jgi:pimeloyl-ACP methyl ester carboxylesterase
MDDIELRGIEASAPLVRAFDSTDNSFKTTRVDTPYGSILVAHHGLDKSTSTSSGFQVPNASKPIILTYPDLGLNHITNFQAFFNFSDMKLLMHAFPVVHVNPPGQEEGAASLPDYYVYPTMDQLGEQIGSVIEAFNAKTIIGLGVGLGANVLARYALEKREFVDGLFLINATASQSSWTEWIYQKVNMYYLGGVAASISGGSFPQATQDYLMWHHFGRVDSDRNHDLIQIYRKHFSGNSMSGRNLSFLIDSYIKRNDLGIVRGDTEKNIKCPILIMTGHFAPHVDDTVAFNARLNPHLSTWMKLQDCGMVLEEQPAKVAEALRLFIQGLGYSLSILERRRSSLRKNSASVVSEESSSSNSRASSMDNGGTDGNIHILTNPIADVAAN